MAKTATLKWICFKILFLLISGLMLLSTDISADALDDVNIYACSRVRSGYWEKGGNNRAEFTVKIWLYDSSGNVKQSSFPYRFDSNGSGYGRNQCHKLGTMINFTTLPTHFRFELWEDDKGKRFDFNKSRLGSSDERIWDDNWKYTKSSGGPYKIDKSFENLFYKTPSVTYYRLKKSGSGQGPKLPIDKCTSGCSSRNAYFIEHSKSIESWVLIYLETIKSTN